MSSEELDHLYELLSIHSERLKELEKIEARYGVDTQAHILTEIKSLRRKLHSLKNTINAIEQPTFEQEVLYQEVEYEPTYNSSLDEFINSLPFSRKTLFIIVGTIIAATILYLFASSGPILTDDFSVNAGLGSWRTNGSVTLTLDNSTQIPIEAQESGTPQPTELPKDTVQLQGSNSYLFKILDDKTSTTTLYTVNTWCKAPQGSRCRLFLGDLKEGLAHPKGETNNTITRDGTSTWQSMAITVEIPKDTQLAVFLYSEGEAATVLYDNIQVTK